MSYVVFARKYRPQSFADMVGQAHIGRTLGNAIAQDRVHHAYLFAGARGLGKTTTARIFAKGLVCEKGPTAEPCNACTQCVAVNEGSSVDVVEIDGASNNSVDNIRNLREQVHYLPQTARRKVYIIDEVHMLTTSAFNALLKTLEEPPPHVNFVFATTEPQKVLPTILSRVNRLDFRRVSLDDLVAHLRSILDREALGMDPGGLRLVARAAGGSVRDSLTLLDQVVAFAADPQHILEDEVLRLLGQADRSAVADLVDAVLAGDPTATLGRFERLVQAGHDLGVLGMQVLEHLRDLAVVKVCGSREVLPEASDAEYARLATQAERADSAIVSQLFDRFSRIMDRLPTSQAQRLLLEMGLLDLASTEPVMPLGDLVERLQALATGRPQEPGSGGTAAGGRGRVGSATPREASRSRGAAPQERTDFQPAEHPASPPSFRPASSPTPERASGPPPAPEPASSPTPAPEPAASPIAAVVGPPVTPPAPAVALDSDLARNLWELGLSHGVVSTDSSEAAPVHAPTSGPAATPSPAPAIAQPLAPDTSTTSGFCLPPPPADGVITWESLEPFAAWELLLGRVREADDFLAAVLAEVGLAKLAGGAIELAAPRGSFAHNELSKHPEMRAQLEQATRDHFGAPFVVTLVEGQPVLPDLPSLVLVSEDRRGRLRAQVEADAREHPRLAAVVSTFNASITATRPLQEP